MRCDVVAFPELALTTFFPRWPLENEREIDSFYETEMPGPETRPLFEEAGRLGIGFSLGYANWCSKRSASDDSTLQSWSTSPVG